MKYCRKNDISKLLSEKYVRDILFQERNVMLPRELSDAVLGPYGFACVSPAEVPEGMKPDAYNDWDAHVVYDEETNTYTRVMKLSPVPAEKIGKRLKEKEEKVRSERNRLLLESDWAMIRSIEAGVNREEWSSYRNKLRDIPEQEGFPFDVEYPVIPIMEW